MDGIDVGKEILRQNPGCRSIIASGEWERFKEGYVIRAVRFVTKPFDEEEIAEALAEASNMAYVEKEEGDAFVLEGQKFRIARRRREEVRRAYIDFKLKYRGRMGVWQ